MSAPKLKPGSFAFTPAALCLDPRLGRPALRVGMLMATRSNAARECWLAADSMAAMLQMSRSSVIAGLAELVKCGHVRRRRRSSPGRGMSSSVYTLQFRDPAALEFLPQEDSDAADEETPDPVTSPAGHRPPPDDLYSRSPAPDPVTDFEGAGDQKQGGPVTSPAGHDQYMIEKEYRDDDEERARAREASSSSASEDYSQEGQAILAFDEMAGRVGWPRALRLSRGERKQLTELLQHWSLTDWHDGLLKAEASAYLAKTKPGIRFFLSENNFAQLVRGRYGREFDPPLTGAAAVMAGIREAMNHRSDVDEQPMTVEPPAPPMPPRDRLADELVFIGQATRRTKVEMDALARVWIAKLEAAGYDHEGAKAAFTDAACRVVKTGYAIEAMNERIAVLVQRRAASGADLRRSVDRDGG